MQRGSHDEWGLPLGRLVAKPSCLGEQEGEWFTCAEVYLGVLREVTPSVHRLSIRSTARRIQAFTVIPSASASRLISSTVSARRLTVTSRDPDRSRRRCGAPAAGSRLA